MSAPVRGAFEIIRDFAAASGRLHAVASDWRASQFKTSDLTDAANTVEGLRALLCELRAGESGE